MFFEFVHILVHVFEIIVEAHALCFQFHGQFFDHLVDFVVDHDLRDIDFGIVDSRLQDFRVEFSKAWKDAFDSRRLRMSALRSSTLSNLPASLANSSSMAGSSLRFTSLTLTAKTASLPARDFSK